MTGDVDAVDSPRGRGRATSDDSAFEPLLSPKEHEEAKEHTFTEFLAVAWQSRMLTLMPMLLFYVAGFGFVLPYVPNLMTDFFASQSAGHDVRCEDYPPPGPKPCIEASDTYVTWGSYKSFFSNVVLTFLLSPMMGVWSDVAGRKPFMLIGQCLSTLSYLVLAGNAFFGVSLYFYYPAEALSSAVSVLVAMLAFVADVMPPRFRATGFAWIYGLFAAGFAITPTLGSLMGARVAIAAGVVAKLLGILYTAVFVPESVPPETKAAARESLRRQRREAQEPLVATPRAAPHEPLVASGASTSGRSAAVRLLMRVPAFRCTVAGFSIILRNREFMKLVSVLMLSTLLSQGLWDVLNQYFVSLFGFRAVDFSRLFIVFGVSSFTVQIFLVQPIVARLGEKGALVLSQVAGSAKFLGLAAAQSKLGVYGTEFVGALTGLSVPTITSIKANAVEEHEQGAVQGALSGAQALASGFGPLVFMQIWRLCTQTLSPPQPRLVVVACTVLSVVPLAIVACVNLERLQAYKYELRASTAAQGAGSPRPAGEATPCEAGAPLSGHDIMVAEGALPHGDGARDHLLVGLTLEGEALRHSGRASHPLPLQRDDFAYGGPS